MIEIRAGATTLPQWRRLLAGEGASVDAGARSAVEASAAVIERIVAQGEVVYGVNTGFGKLAGVRIGADSLSALQRNLVLSHAAGVGPALPDGVVRLVLALKIASLLHGASGVRWALIERLETALARGLLPEIPAQGSVGASGDLAPLAHLAAALFLGVGAIRRDGVSAPAGEALAAAGLEPLPPGPKEGLALLNGTQVSTALALAGLFATERAFQAALVAGALSVDAAKGSDTPFDDRIHALRGHRGQRDVAAAYRALITGSRIRESHVDCAKVQDPYSLRCQPQVMGAALDVMRQAAGTLEIEAVAVSDNPLVFADTGEVLSGGNFHAEPVAFAADMVALTVAEIGNLAERRIALLTDPVLSGMPAFLTPEPGLNSGFMIAQVTAAALASENKQRATPASIDTIPTSANQEDHVSMATHASRRLLEMAENLVNIVSVELLCGAQAVEFHRPLRSSEPLERVLRLIRDRVPPLGEDRLMAPDIAAIADLVRSGALVETAGLALPAVDSA